MAQVTVRRELDAAPRALVVAVAIALLTAVMGAVLLGLMLRERGALSTAASVGGLTLKVESAQWAELEHDHQQGFQMLAQMTPLAADNLGGRRLGPGLGINACACFRTDRLAATIRR